MIRLLDLPRGARALDIACGKLELELLTMDGADYRGAPDSFDLACCVGPAGRSGATRRRCAPDRVRPARRGRVLVGEPFKRPGAHRRAEPRPHGCQPRLSPRHASLTARNARGPTGDDPLEGLGLQGSGASSRVPRRRALPCAPWSHRTGTRRRQRWMRSTS